MIGLIAKGLVFYVFQDTLPKRDYISRGLLIATLILI